MSIPSLGFLLGIFFFSCFFFLLPTPRIRQGLLAALNAGFLYTLVPDAATAGVLAAFVLSGYGAGLLLRSKPSAALFWTYLAVLVAGFLVLKRYTFLEGVLPEALFDHPIAVVGLSYILFRQIHFVVDAMQGQVKEPSLWVYLNYQLSLFTLLSGPIQRYQDFHSDWARLQPFFADRHELLRAYLRILWGVVQLVLIGGWCADLFDRAVAHPEWSRATRIPAVFYSYPAFVYFNFAGYCNIVIGSGALFGLKVPENFNHPYAARNMIDFWNRWHITLSHWLRDYLFTPLYKALAQRWPERALALAPPCYFVVFLVAGVWHGTTLNFVAFGLAHGIGVSAAKAWENWIIRRRGRKGLKQYMQSRPIALAATTVNFHFACATFLFFPPGLARAFRLMVSLVTGEP